jgi:hypothetical protein
MKTYVTDAEIDELEMEIFHYLDDDVCWERSLEDDYDYMNRYFPTTESLNKMSECLNSHLIAMRTAARLIDSGFRGTMGEEFLMSQDWDAFD